MKQRILTGLAAGTVFGLAMIAGGWYYNVLLVLLSVIGFYEYSRLNSFRWLDPISLIGMAGMLAIVFPWQQAGLQQPSPLALAWLLMFALLAITVFSRNRVALDGASLMLLGAVYIGYGFAEMMTIRSIEPHGLFYTALAFGCIWASDIGAYFVGRAVGKRKLWPAISPNKTIEGAAGGILLSLLVSLAFVYISPGWIGIQQAIGVALVASVAGQLGDLIQSAYKRFRGVKDSGRLLPGHGGILDRCDSWLIVFPLLSLTGLLPS